MRNGIYSSCHKNDSFGIKNLDRYLLQIALNSFCPSHKWQFPIPDCILKEQRLFSDLHLVTVNESVAMAEELVSEHYKMSASEWLRPKYDVKTRVDLSPDEIVPGPFAQVIRYEGRLENASLGSSSYDFYKICLQDHEILAAGRSRCEALTVALAVRPALSGSPLAPRIPPECASVPRSPPGCRCCR